ncbi:MAG: Dihydrolipoyl dehydrogenase [Proteobacteria bacterium]|nr:MAG: Dihydrolipoyl dehydrogenase [Pseudomonadota bacterium]
MTKKFDTVVIGSGPGGYVAAIRASQLGQKVAIIERENLGGICLNWGCIPTKALLKSAEVKHLIEHAEAFGIKAEITDISPEKIVDRSRGVSSNLNQGIGFLMKKNNVEVIEGFAKFVTAKEVEVELTAGGKETVFADNFIVATGARAKEIPGFLESDHDKIWTYRDAMTQKSFPESLLVIGAGAIGVEFGSFYNTFGTKVTIVEAQDAVVPIEDKEISKIVGKSFKEQGMELKLKTSVKAIDKSGDKVKVTLEKGSKEEVIEVSNVLVAIGVTPNTENLGLDKIGVATDERGFIKVDEFYRTNVDGVTAIGDVIGGALLAHVASHEGIICAEGLAGGHPHLMNYDNIPGCTYCHPQVGSVGLTEEQAKEKGLSYRVGRFNYGANGKAQATGDSDLGLVKTIFDKETGELLGAHIVGHEATEMITTFVLAQSLEATDEAIAQACLPHPTLSEMLGESVLDSLGRPLNS